MLAGTHSPSSSRALVTTAPEAHEVHHRPVKRVATFIAQLIASAGRVPQARERRRADPAEVIAAYRATVERLQRLNEKSE